jgi:hypothetical protein
VKQLDKTSLRQACETDQFDFETTEEVSNLTTVLGQERLTSSMEFGMEIDKEGYNIFALGPNQTDKRSHIQQLLNEKSKNGSTPDDICYINNFDDRYKPKLLTLPAGRGTELKKQMEKLIDELPPTLKSAFETEEYQNRQQALQDEVQQQQDQTFEELQNKAREKGLSLMRTPVGFSFAPIDDDGELMNEEKIRNLPDE